MQISIRPRTTAPGTGWRLLLLRSPSAIYLFCCTEQSFLDFPTACLLFIYLQLSNETKAAYCIHSYLEGNYWYIVTEDISNEGFYILQYPVFTMTRFSRQILSHFCWIPSQHVQKHYTYVYRFRLSSFYKFDVLFIWALRTRSAQEN